VARTVASNGTDREVEGVAAPSDHRKRRHVWVYFKVFDADDPLDQDNPNMADVGLIDDDAVGGDNRGGGGMGSYEEMTNALGQAVAPLIISMQPGDNYRAAASVLVNARLQVSQADADALNGTEKSSRSWSGYEVPVVWSEMLTVWRKLHVEVDSMAMADVSNTQTGIIPSAPTFDPGNNRAIIPIAGLQPDFEKPHQHKVGRIDILTFGSFTTIDTNIDSSPYYEVEIINAPANIVNAAGVSYTLWDDDAGSVAPFTMVGFDEPPVTLPKVPDTGLMAEVFAKAYVDVPAPDMQYYDNDAPFHYNVHDKDEARERGNDKRNLTSSEDYWAVHIT
jgi:hypothetical protein